VIDISKFDNKSGPNFQKAIKSPEVYITKKRVTRR
jgi:hypothetical protein